MVKQIFISAKWKKETRLDEETIDELNKFNTISIFSAVNFTNLIPEIIKQIPDVKVIKTKPARAKECGQVLGCDSYIDSFDKQTFESDAILYIGDGSFHPDAILFSQMYSNKKVPVYRWNPIENKLELFNIERLENKIKKIKANLIKFTLSKNIGILVSVKFGQEHLEKAIKLKEKLKSEGKDSYIFLDNTFDFNKIEDYNFIDCWVNSACPRIGQEDCVNLPKAIINIKEAFDVNKYLSDIN